MSDTEDSHELDQMYSLLRQRRCLACGAVRRVCTCSPIVKKMAQDRLSELEEHDFNMQESEWK